MKKKERTMGEVKRVSATVLQTRYGGLTGGFVLRVFSLFWAVGDERCNLVIHGRKWLTITRNPPQAEIIFENIFDISDIFKNV